MNRIILGIIGWWILISFQAFGQRPFVTNLDKTVGAPGDKISISGINFPTNPANIKVQFGAGSGAVTYASANLIEVTVPGNATYGNVSVTDLTNGLTGYSSQFFTLAFGGTSFVPTSIDSPSTFASNQNGMYDLCTCDFDGDGLIDVATSQNNEQASRVPVFHNSSTIDAVSLAAVNLTSLVIGDATIGITCGDLDGDGKPELVATRALAGVTPGNILFVFKNTSSPGTISFSSPISLTLPDAVSGNKKNVARAYIIDLDGDGKPEIIATNQVDNQIDEFRNTSSGGTLSFDPQPAQFTIGGSRSFGLSVRDLNNDGFPEIIASALQQANVYVLPNTSSPGTINFGSSITVPVAGQLANLVVGDLNGDGLNDIAATQILQNQVSVLLNSTSGVGGDITFGTSVGFAVASTPWGIDLGDVDGNGKLDILVASTTSNNVTVLANQTTGTLAFSRFSISAGEPTRNVVVADINADGKPDLLATGISNNNVVVLPNRHCLTPVISPTNSVVCAGSDFVLEATKSIGHTYVWETGPSAAGPFTAQPETSSSLNLSSLAVGDLFIRATVRSNEGVCEVSSASLSQVVVSGTPPPPPNIADPVPLCTGATLEVDGSVNGAKSYEWTGPAGFSSTEAVLTVPDFDPSKSGIYTLRYVTQSDCLSPPNEIRAEIKSLPAIAVRYEGNGLFCQGATVDLTAATYAGYNYQWFRDGNDIAGETSASLRISATGQYSVQIADPDTNCEVGSSSLQLTRKSFPVSQFDSPDAVCEDIPVEFSATSTGEAGLTLTYAWDFTNNGVNDATTAIANNTYATPGSPVVRLTTGYDEIAACTNSATKTMEIRPVPVVDIVASEGVEKCPENSLPLEVPATFLSYSWNTGETSRAITVDAAGNYTVTIVDDAQCVIVSSIAITDFDTSNTITANANRSLIDEFDTTQFNVVGATEIISWDPTTGFDTPLSATPIVTGTYETGETLNAAGHREYVYVVTALDLNSCQVSASIPLAVIPDENPQPMKSFSPNGDGANDFWIVENVEFNEDCKLIIYDRRGRAVLEENPYLNDWDGRTTNGNEIEQGVYYYVFMCDDPGRNRNGSILLFR